MVSEFVYGEIAAYKINLLVLVRGKSISNTTAPKVLMPSRQSTKIVSPTKQGVNKSYLKLLIHFGYHLSMIL
jgi:hypothetical protein